METLSQPETPMPMLLVAELSYKCPLHCPYCSNPVDIGAARYRGELSTADWSRVFEEAADLGVLQLALTGGEPMLRKDIVELAAAARAAGLYSTLVTAGTLFTRAKAEALKEAGLDHVQVSFQDANATGSDHVAGLVSFEKKLEASRLAREYGFPLTVNTVLHRLNLPNVGELIDLANGLGARRIELANTQYQGWALVNREALMPTRAQIEEGERVVEEARARIGSAMEILWVLPDYYEELPKPCQGGWGQHAMVIAPNGEVLPCQAATSIPELSFDNVTEKSLEEIWYGSSAFNAFRGFDWMKEPCRSCPLERQHADFGGCRCQALAITGDPRAVDPVCHLSDHHHVIVGARIDEAPADPPPLVFRSTRRQAVAT
jgi:pyrroloquinoline quinone biosynthesis protein E